MSFNRNVGEYDFSPSCNIGIPYSSFNLRFSGWLAKVLYYIIQTPLSYSISFLANKLFNMQLLQQLKIEDEPTKLPIGKEAPLSDSMQRFPQSPETWDESSLSTLIKTDDTWLYPTILHYSRAYIEKKQTPLMVASRIVKLCRKHKVLEMCAITSIDEVGLLKAAAASTKRYQEGRALSVFDGVPFFVKDHIQVAGYTITFGCTSIRKECTETATCLKRLLEFGALMCGFTNMTQMGSNPIGYNPSPKHPPCRNPWDPSRYVGGSSGGSAAVVAIGLCPFAIGSDSYGSIRIPASMSGMVGLRSTFGRISNYLAVENADGHPFAVMGPIANCASDAALVYMAMAGGDRKFLADLEFTSAENILKYPVLVPATARQPLGGLCVGVCSSYMQNANPPFVVAVEKVCQALQSDKASIKEVVLPELEETYLSGLTGMLVCRLREGDSLESYRRLVSTTEDISVLCSHVFCTQGAMRLKDTAERQRTRAMHIMTALFEQVDVLIIPTHCSLPEQIAPRDNYLGMIDARAMKSHMMFVTLSSVTGVPSITTNAHFDERTGLPISVQLLARWWREDLLLTLADYIQKKFPLNRLPTVHYTPMDH